MSIAQKSQRGTIHPTSEEAGILCPRTPSFLKIPIDSGIDHGMNYSG